MQTSFWDRLQRVIDDRKPFAWAQSIGWKKAFMSKVTKQGHIPGPELLVPLSRIENARLDWLLTGRGRPYFGEPMADKDAAEEIAAHLQDSPDWTIHLITHDQRIAVALTMPAQIDVKGTTIDYTALELFIGTLGQYVMAELNTQAKEDRVYRAAQVDETTWFRLQAGEFGTYQLLEKSGGILGGEFKPRGVSEYLEIVHVKPLRAAEEAGEYGNALVLTPEEHRLLERVKNLSAEDREVVEHLLQRLTP